MQRIHVLQVYYEPQPSGQTAHVLSLARGLDPRRYDLTVVLPEHLQTASAAFHDTGARVVLLPLGKILWPPRALFSLARLIRHQDVVHVHSQEAGLVARPVARLAGAPALLYTPQTVDIHRAQWHGLYRTAERALAHLTDIVISVNDADRQRLIRWGLSPLKVVAVPNGLDLAPFGGPVDARSLRQELGLDPDRPLVLQVGRLGAQKDPLAFVDGAAQVLAQFPDVQFALAGEGPLHDQVAARIRQRGLTGRVHLLGWRPAASRLMATADAVTLTSRWEGTPYALLEAMACARPVVATAVNGCPEVVLDGDTGFLVPPGDPAAWARAVAALLADPINATAMGRRGRVRGESHFALEGMIARLQALYERVVSQRQRPQGYP
jgi:glycosyltransferase involved in cell wall biosynthesis